jgi:hypothetical protein
VADAQSRPFTSNCDASDISNTLRGHNMSCCAPTATTKGRLVAVFEGGCGTLFLFLTRNVRLLTPRSVLGTMVVLGNVGGVTVLVYVLFLVGI